MRQLLGFLTKVLGGLLVLLFLTVATISLVSWIHSSKGGVQPTKQPQQQPNDDWQTWYEDTLLPGIIQLNQKLAHASREPWPDQAKAKPPQPNDELWGSEPFYRR